MRHHQPARARTRSASVGQPLDGHRAAARRRRRAARPRAARAWRGYRNDPRRRPRRSTPTAGCTPATSRAIDDDGYVWIVDRKKELIINAAGKNMSPANIEARLKAAGPLIGQACVDRRPPALQRGAARARPRRRAPALDPAGRPAVVRARCRREVDAANAHLSRVEQIKRFRDPRRPSGCPGGDELTPTMKLKRRPIAEKYAGEIDAPVRLDSRVRHGRTPPARPPARAGRQRPLLDRLRQRRLVDLLRARPRRVVRARPHAGRLRHHRLHLLPDGRHLRRGDGDVPGGGRLVVASRAAPSTSSGPSSPPGRRCSTTRSRSPSRRSSCRTTSAGVFCVDAAAPQPGGHLLRHRRRRRPQRWSTSSASRSRPA